MDTTKQTWFERHPLLMSVIIFLLFTVVIDVILSFFLIPREYNRFRVQDPYYHHGLLPNQNTLAAWGPIVYPFATNNLGFRAKVPEKVAPETTKKRVLILGDSHSEAVGIRYEHSYAGILNEYGASVNTEVLNASAVSYSPKIHRYKLDYLLNRVGLKVDEVWVVLDISDIQNEIAYEKFVPSNPGLIQELWVKLKRFSKKRSYICYSLTRIIDNRKLDQFTNAMYAFSEEGELGSRNMIELYASFFSSFEDKDMLRSPEFHGVGNWIYDTTFLPLAQKGISLGMENIHELYSACKENNIQVKLSVHPWQKQVSIQDTTDYYVETWRKFCGERGIDFINLFPLFINGENPEIVNKKYYLYKDNHWNENGHSLVGNYLKKYLVK
jgi:hypothetical protein